MNIINIINKKKQGFSLTEQEIDFFIKGYCIENSIFDYQASSLLMAMTINGLDEDETFFFTKSFYENSKHFIFPKNNELIIDKHSSGGVGDKVSLIIVPILASLGYGIVKMSGRSLGHTGGTIDKLDSINFFSNLSFDKAKQIYSKNKIVLMQQTDELVIADRKIYALRDVTGTVDCPGLIVSSILSKKFVLNSDYIYIDLKVGSGALIKSNDEAEKLANLMIKVANRMNRKLSVIITNMDEPLGKYVGNFLEIKESIEFLQGINQDIRLKNLIYDFVSTILIDTKKVNNQEEAKKMIDQVIDNLEAYQVFVDWLKNQNADLSSFDRYDEIIPNYSHDILATDDGYLDFKSTTTIGLVSLELGSGRTNKDDKIDYLAGIRFYKKSNDVVKKGDKVATLYSSKPIKSSIINLFMDNLLINKLGKKEKPIIIRKLDNY